MTDIKTIFFDFDGVVVDSEPIHAKAKKLVLERFHICYPATIFDDYKGRTDNVFFEYVATDLDTQKRQPDLFLNAKNAIFEEIISELKLIDGFLLFYEKAKKRGIETALVSSTSLYSLGSVDAIYHLTGLFDLVITKADTVNHKPHPAPYLKALEMLPANTRNTIVIEDSPNGILSAKDAGCFVYGLTSSFSEAVLKEYGADDIIDSYPALEKKLGL